MSHYSSALSKSNRDHRLQAFLTSLADALAIAVLSEEAEAVVGKIYVALGTPHPAGQRPGRQMPVCEYLSEALVTARSHSEPIARLANSFSELRPLLFWAPRGASGPFASDNWLEGHANATIVGPHGLETRNDLQIGWSLPAPQVPYLHHTLATQDVYIVVSPANFQHGSSTCFEPGIGDTLYNQPHLKHAMAPGDTPLLAIWCLWTEKNARERPVDSD